MQKYHLWLVLPIFILGCATGGVHKASAPSTKLSRNQSICINVSATTSAWSPEASSLKGILIAKLDESGIFRNITTDADTADLRLDVLIVRVKRVSGASRVLVGAMAGRAGINTESRLYDVRSNASLASFDAYGRSSGGTVFAGTTAQAIDRVADKICDFLKKNTD